MTHMENTKPQWEGYVLGIAVLTAANRDLFSLPLASLAFARTLFSLRIPILLQSPRL